jgi:hypothetical protein
MSFSDFVLNIAEIHRFFEQQMDDMLRSFGQLGVGSFGGSEWGNSGNPGGGGGHWGGHGGGRFLEDSRDLTDERSHGRDFMLKHDGEKYVFSLRFLSFY